MNWRKVYIHFGKNNMEKTILSGYLWGYDRPYTADICFKKFRESYSDGKLYFRLDVGGKEEEHKEICDKWGAKFLKNPMKVGRCGWMGHYEDWEEKGSDALGRECWPKENAFTWMDGVYEAAKDCNSEYLIVMEDDTFILRPISVIEEGFGISVCEYNCNQLPNYLCNFIDEIGGDSDIPRNLFGRRGYGAMGGFIINCETFIKGWDKLKPILDERWDEIREQTHLIGWVDVLPQLAVMSVKGKVIMNTQHVQTWYKERPDLYPAHSTWEDYEIVDFLKDEHIIKNL